jgi:pilus assembly protein CpaE
VVNPDNVRVVVNRFRRRGEIQQDTIDMLILGERSEVLIPDLEQGLERAGNSRTPSEARNGVWWKSLRRIGQELRVMSQYRPASPAVAGNGQPPPREAVAQPDLAASNGTAPPVAPRLGGSGQRESGQIALENVVLIPIALLLLVCCLQLALFGLGSVSAGSAADAAARAVSIGEDPEAAARAAVPEQLAGGIDVEQAGNQVTVRFSSPLLWVDGVTRTVTAAVDHGVVEEPR